MLRPSIGATTAEKLEGTSRGMDANPIPPCPFSPHSLPRLPLLFQYPDRWISDTAAPVCVLIVLEVLVAVVQSI